MKYKFLCCTENFMYVNNDDENGSSRVEEKLMHIIEKDKENCHEIVIVFWEQNKHSNELKEKK